MAYVLFRTMFPEALIPMRQTCNEIFKIVCDTFHYSSMKKAWMLVTGAGWLFLFGVGEELTAVRKEKLQRRD